MHLLQANVRWKRLSGSHPGGRSPLSVVTTKVYVREVLTVSCREMLDDDLEADGNEDEAANDLDFALEEMAEAFAEGDAAIGQNKGDQADDRYGQGNRGFQQGKRDPYRQRVDAGRERQDQQDEEVGGIAVLLGRFDLEGLIDHLAPDKAQQRKRHPVIVRGDVSLQAQTRQKADDGHDRLKSAKEQGHAQRVADLEFLV